MIASTLKVATPPSPSNCVREEKIFLSFKRNEERNRSIPRNEDRRGRIVSVSSKKAVPYRFGRNHFPGTPALNPGISDFVLFITAFFDFLELQRDDTCAPPKNPAIARRSYI